MSGITFGAGPWARVEGARGENNVTVTTGGCLPSQKKAYNMAPEAVYGF